MNNLTGRSWCAPCHCLILAGAIAPSLVSNKSMRLLTASHHFSRSVRPLEGHSTILSKYSENFSQREFTATLQHLKPGRAPGPDSICPQLITALKSWFLDFLSSCLCQFKIPKICWRAIVIMIPKPMKPVGDPKNDISNLCPMQDPQKVYLHLCWTNY